MWETVLTITVIATLAMISPGPDFVLVVKNAARYSRRAALATTVGINLGIAVHMSYCILGLALIIAQTPWLFGLLKYAGAGYLIWIGVQALFSRGGLAAATALAVGRARQRASRLSGRAAVQSAQPKATLFFFSVFTQLLRLDSTLTEKALIGLVIFLLGVIYWPCVALAVQHPRVMALLHVRNAHRPPAGRRAGGAGRQGGAVLKRPDFIFAGCLTHDAHA